MKKTQVINKKMKGIRFKIENEYDNIFYKIFKNIDFNEYNWNIVEDEIYILGGEFCFEKDCYPNKEFQNIAQFEKYYPVFANIQVYGKVDEVEDIQIYQDFINSKCQLILFITDNEFVDIYSKNEDWLNVIYQNAIENNFSNIRYIEDENFKIRCHFSAYSD